MLSNEFHFLEEWTIPDFSPREIWSGVVAADPKTLPRWWRGVYQEVELAGAEGGLRLGASARVTARGFLPYRLRFVLEVTDLTPGAMIAVRSRGDLEGIWQAKLSGHSSGSHVAIEWRVTVNKPIVRLLSPLLKPIFARNHTWTTPRGEAGLRAYMNQYAAASVLGEEQRA
ncbi:hypothetical protein [Mesorhizobium sp.]|uniref:hypothetical protein n=1 Tax=Mesorhizobium sp. TaxID=1871066 RepID=UPI0012195ED5|nr:hypothetical protein [Mesorhizobium sp.]TIS88413.1 MAG: hypothetical protein E5W89_20125 [Mesorhizobium sp.]